jgi:hypothetical protein
MSTRDRLARLERSTYGTDPDRCRECGLRPDAICAIHIVYPEGHPMPSGLLPAAKRPPCPTCGQPNGPIVEFHEDGNGNLYEFPDRRECESPIAPPRI